MTLRPDCFRPLVDILPVVLLGVARYAFGKSGRQSARHTNIISTVSNDRIGLNTLGRRCGTPLVVGAEHPCS